MISVAMIDERDRRNRHRFVPVEEDLRRPLAAFEAELPVIADFADDEMWEAVSALLLHGSIWVNATHEERDQFVSTCVQDAARTVLSFLKPPG